MQNKCQNLVIGLGGAGGWALQYLKKLCPDDRGKTKLFFLDTDFTDVRSVDVPEKQKVFIGRSGSVIQLARQLSDGRPLKWLPGSSADRVFLFSRERVEYSRLTTRLYLGMFLKDNAPGLMEILEELAAQSEQRSPKIIIFSSLSGSMGSGAFLELALYLRRFFENRCIQVRITGIFCLPDVSALFANNETEKAFMYSRAYAALRELNAINLTEAYGSNSDPVRCLPNAPARPHIPQQRIVFGEEFEPPLFDSDDPAWRNGTHRKPYDRALFVDRLEGSGPEKTIYDYYQDMAQIAYTHLYSPINNGMISLELDEARNHSKVPTAIYGSAGYARILYPYKDIIRYLTEKMLYIELGSQWLFFDALWDAESRMELDAAEDCGGCWVPKPGQRGRQFQNDLNEELQNKTSMFAFLEPLIYDSRNQSRVQAFAKEIEKAASSLDEYNSYALPKDLAELSAYGGGFSVLRDAEVIRILNRFNWLLDPEPIWKYSDADWPFSTLVKNASDAENLWSELTHALENAVKIQTYKLSSAILPLTEIAVSNHDPMSPISLHHALLSKENSGDIHPLAARYLLYGFQDICITRGSEDKNALRDSLDMCLRRVRLVLDNDLSDEEDITVPMVVEELNRRRLLGRKKKESIAKELMETFCDALKKNLENALFAADRAVISGVYNTLKKPVAELISLYEGFFEAVVPYRDALERQISADLVRHDSGDSRTIFVGASSQLKRAYSEDPSVVGALYSVPDAIHAAAGACVFENLFARLRKRTKALKTGNPGEGELPSEQFGNIEEIFDSILKKYDELLEKNGPLKPTTAASALIKETCANLGFSKEEIHASTENKTDFEYAFRRQLGNLIAKAHPMLRYKAQDFFFDDGADDRHNVSLALSLVGFSPDSATEICQIFESDSTDPDTLSAFCSRMNLDYLQVDPFYHDNEICCFRMAVCLEPSQINRFCEAPAGDSYYQYYKKLLTSEWEGYYLHLDNRWSVSAVLPFLCPDTESSWLRQTMKAFLCDALCKGAAVVKDPQGLLSFYRKKASNSGLIVSDIPIGEISRLAETYYYQPDQETSFVETLDQIVENTCRSLSFFIESPSMFKTGISKSHLFEQLKSALYSFNLIAKQDNVRPEDSDGTEDSEAAGNPLGGVFHIACLLHRSELRLEQHYGFGPELIKVVEEIVDRIALSMHGAEQTRQVERLRAEYEELRSWCLQELMQGYLDDFSSVSNRPDVPVIGYSEEDRLWLERLLTNE